MRKILAVAVLALFASGLVAQDAKKYESKDGKFSVKFPAEPKTNTSKAKDIDLVVTIVEKGKGGFAVIYSDMPADVVKGAQAQKLLQGGETGLVEQFKAKVSSSKETTFGPKKYPAREIVAEKDENHLRILLVLADNRLYQVFVVRPKDMVGKDDKEVDDFFASFEINK